MGMFKQMKDLKQMVAAAPGMIDQANQLAAQAQQLQGAHLAQAQQLQAMSAGPTIPAGDPRLQPIAGVSLERYAGISKALQGAQARTSEEILRVIAAKGVDAASWQLAYDGWNERMEGDMALATQFGHLYTEAAG